jgi:ribosomal protein S18 acetylase RimI-like enzyme
VTGGNAEEGDVNIRRLHEGDEDAAVRVVEGVKFRMDEIVGRSVDPAYMRGFLADDRHYLVAAYVEEGPVGMLLAYRLLRLDGTPSVLYVWEVGVVEHHRRRGIGRALVEEAKRLANEDGCRSMIVPTETSNEAAMALYRAAGGEHDPDVTEFSWEW